MEQAPVNKRNALWILLVVMVMVTSAGCQFFESEATPGSSGEQQAIQATEDPGLDRVSLNVTQTGEGEAGPEEEAPVQESITQPAQTGTPAPIPTATVMPAPESASIGEYLAAELAPLLTVKDLPGQVTVVAFSPDSLVLAAGSSDGNVRLWRSSDGSQLALLEGHTAPVRDLSFSSDGSLLASAGEDSAVMIWDVAQRSLTRIIDTSFAGRALAVAISPGGEQIAVGGSKCFVALYAAWSGLFTRTFPQAGCSLIQGGSTEHWGLSYSRDGSQLMIADGQLRGSGGTVQVRRLDEFSSPEIIKGFELGVRDLATSPDGSTLAVALVGSSRVWVIEAAGGKIIHTLEGHQLRVNSIAYSPDGWVLASGSRDGTVRLWSAESGLQLRTLPGQNSAVNSVAFSPDGSLIASGTDDGGVVVWGLATRPSP